MRVMSMAVVDLEALRAHLHAEAIRIRSEYETRLLDIEGDLAADDRLLSRIPAMPIAEPVFEVTTEAELAARASRQPNWKRALAGLGQHEAVVTSPRCDTAARSLWPRSLISSSRWG